MPRITLFLMRHSKSCSNHTRSDESDPSIAISKSIRDPCLSAVGTRAARRYSAILHAHLYKYGFDANRALICASMLGRAQDTARIVFGRRPIVLPHFAENGAIPENTPKGHAYAAPSWPRFIAHLSTLVGEGDAVVVVGHGSYLKSLWPHLTGAQKATRLNNLDGILLDADIGPKGLRVRSFKEILYTGPSMMSGPDKCAIVDTRKIAAIRKGMTRKQQKQRSKRSKRSKRSQRGGNGSTGMPLAYFQDGAQMKGTFAEPTGVGLAGTTSSMVRAPLMQSGGRVRTRKNRRQGGGFSAAIMGSFAANGAKLMPLAGYMGYKMYSNQKKTRKQ
jgi:phosphohistidine phosphatase SixA